jgi:peptide deformylase
MNILTYPNPILRKRSADVKVGREDLSTILDEMYKTMYEANGCGLAASQVGLLKKIVVIDIRDEAHPAYRLINPRIVWKSNELVESEEGCLSLPLLRRVIKRHERVSVEYQDESFNRHLIDNADGLLAICLQHELDHLQGKLFIDRLSKSERLRAIRELQKLQQQMSSIENSDVVR